MNNALRDFAERAAPMGAAARLRIQERKNRERLIQWRDRWMVETGRRPDIYRHARQKRLGLNFPLTGWPDSAAELASALEGAA